MMSLVLTGEGCSDYNLEDGAILEEFRVYSRLQRESGGTGRRARLRISWETVGVQVPPLAPTYD
jgi:hypothetical protein